jgi:hypothetical protein
VCDHNVDICHTGTSTRYYIDANSGSLSHSITFVRTQILNAPAYYPSMSYFWLTCSGGNIQLTLIDSVVTGVTCSQCLGVFEVYGSSGTCRVNIINSQLVNNTGNCSVVG